MSSSNETTNNNSSSQMAEKEEEMKLKSKYPQMQRPGPQFLQKRLQKGQKFFDSGDYNMAKAAAAKGSAGKSRLSESVLNQNPPLPPASAAVGLPQSTSPTSEIIPPITARKPSIHVPSKLVSGGP